MTRGVLDVRDHDCWRVEIELLHGAIGPDREETCARSVERHTADMLKSRNRVKSNVLCAHIPRQGFATLVSKLRRVEKFPKHTCQRTE